MSNISIKLDGQFRSLKIKRYVVIIGAIWTFVVAGALFWETYHEAAQIKAIAHTQAKSSFLKDLAFRLWATEHGGVYVPQSQKTPPNPYLSHIKERDISTPSGRKLTLMNPAYMIRQVMESYNQLQGVQSKITSLKPINPINQPDKWEAKALTLFETNEKQNKLVEVTQLGGKDHLRFIHAIKTQEKCLKCHGKQGYKTDDIRGGISITVPLHSLQQNKSNHALPLFIIWLLGIIGLFLGYTQIKHRIEERNNIQNQLENMNQVLSSTLTALPDHLYVIDAKNNIEDFRTAGWSSINSSRDSFPSNNKEQQYADFFPSHAVRIIQKCIAQARIHGSATGECFKNDAENGARWFEPSAALCRGDCKKLEVVMLVRDITNRRLAEQALEETAHRLQSIVEASSDIIVLLDTDYNFLFINRTHSGISPNDLIGKCFYKMAVPEQQMKIKAALNEVVLQQKTSQYSVPHPVPGIKEVQIFDTVVAPIINEGVVTGLVVVARNVTEQKLLENQLRHSQKMEAIGTLAGGVAHDFNNLLSVIMGHGDLALENIGKTHPAFNSVNTILQAADKAASLVSRLLAFSRKQLLNLEELNLNQVVEHTIEMLHRVLGEQIQIEFLPSSEIGLIYGDKTQLEQVIINLCVNARDAMPQGGRLTLSTQVSSLDNDIKISNEPIAAGNYIKLAIIDTGFGMKKEVLDRIFDPFFTTKEVGSGTGLGLSMLYGIVKQHKGYVQVKSAPNQGSEFHIYLPQSTVPMKEQNHLAQSGPLIGGVETILLAEDDEILRNLTATILEKAGYNVLVTKDGIEAIKKWDSYQKKIDLLLLDVVMPLKNGEDVHQYVKEIDASVKVIFMTGYAENALHDKQAVIIKKPIQRRLLLAKVRQVLNGPKL